MRGSEMNRFSIGIFVVVVLGSVLLFLFLLKGKFICVEGCSYAGSKRVFDSREGYDLFIAIKILFFCTPQM
jgi:hypothetical protein